MITSVKSSVLNGSEADPVIVEVSSNWVMPGERVTKGMTASGISATAASQANQRVRSALLSLRDPEGHLPSCIPYTTCDLEVSVTPSQPRKKGFESGLDVSIAIGILRNIGLFDESAIEHSAFIGELSLAGDVMPVR